MRGRTIWPVFAVWALLLIAGCAEQLPLPPAPPPIPAKPAEFIPKPPVSEQPLIWQPGHWDWTGHSYAWTSGSYVLRAGHGNLWTDGYWALVNGAWSWVGPHWS